MTAIIAKSLIPEKNQVYVNPVKFFQTKHTNIRLNLNVDVIVAVVVVIDLALISRTEQNN